MDNPAAWHPDPAGKHDHRWWDGQRWTEHVADAGVASIDPLPDAPGPVDSGPTDTGPTDTGPAEPGPTEPGPTDVGPTEPGPTAAGPTGADATGRGGAPDAAEATGTAGTAPGDGAIWEREATQEPWGGAPPSGGYQGQPPTWTQAGSSAGSSGMAVGSLICGIVAIPLAFMAGLGAILGIVAVVLGVIVLRRNNRGAAGGRGLAIGGLVTGGISIVLGLVVVIFLFTFGMGVFSEMEACLEETGGDEQECQRRLERDLTERFLEE